MPNSQAIQVMGYVEPLLESMTVNLAVQSAEYSLELGHQCVLGMDNGIPILMKTISNVMVTLQLNNSLLTLYISLTAPPNPLPSNSNPPHDHYY